jgi:cobalt-zinc-cadmium efflux system outer membrane protein
MRPALLGIALLAALALPPSATAEPLTLAGAIARARQLSPQRQAAQLRSESASAAERLVSRLGNPVLEIRSENWGAGASPSLDLDTFAVVSQPIELGGKFAARRGELAAAAGASAVHAGLVDRELAREVARRYVDVLRARSASSSLTTQRDELGAIVRILERRAAEGAAAEADLRRFESERARIDALRTRADLAIRIALARLNALVGGQPLGAEDLVAPAEGEVSPPLATAAPNLDARSDVAVATAHLASARAALATERARGVPDLLVSGGYKRTGGVPTGVVAVSVPVPLFDRNRAAVRLADGAVQAAERELAFAREQARAEATALAESARDLAALAGRIEAAQAHPAAIVRTAARAAFDEGAGDLLRLMDAERVFAESTRDVLDVRLDAVLAAIDARLARGEEPLP